MRRRSTRWTHGLAALAAALLLSRSGGVALGCDRNDGPMEEAGEAMDETAEEAEESAEEMGDEIEEEME